MHTNDVPPASIPINGTQRRESSKFCSMFWVTNSEGVIDDHPTQPISMTAETWKEKKDSMEYLNDRTWRFHAITDYVLRTGSSVLHRFWRDHISDQNGRRSNIPPYAQAPFAAVPKATFSFAMTVMDKVEGWNEEKVGGVKIRCERVDLHQSRIM